MNPGSDSNLADEGQAVLEVEHVVKHFLPKRRSPMGLSETVHAVCGVDLVLHKGRALGLVGESGSGKSTLARLATGLVQPTEGRVLIQGRDFWKATARERREIRRHVQIVFQDPFSSLNPVRTISDIVAEPLRVGRYEGDIRSRVLELFELVGLSTTAFNRYPHEFSGGQRQRISIARALASSPDVLVLDEPVSALDVSTQAQILNLLKRLQHELKVSCLLIAHDLSVVGQFVDDIAVMHLGTIVETGTVDSVYGAPAHPYTHALLSAVTIPDPSRRDDPKRIVLVGDPPKPTSPPSGCRFRTRCWLAADRCAAVEPQLDEGGGHRVACHFPIGTESESLSPRRVGPRA